MNGKGSAGSWKFSEPSYSKAAPISYSSGRRHRAWPTNYGIGEFMTGVPGDSNRGKEMPVREFLPRARVDWSLVHGLLEQDLIVDTEYEGQTYFIRKFPKSEVHT